MTSGSPTRCNVAAPLLDFEKHDTEEKNRARNDRDDADCLVKSAHDLESLRRSDGDVLGPVRLEAERSGVDLIDRPIDRAFVSSRNRKTVDAITVLCERLKVIEMHPNAVLAARDFGRIGAAFYDCGDYNGVAGCFGNRRQCHAVADFEICIGSEALIDRYGALRRLEKEDCREKRNDHA